MKTLLSCEFNMDTGCVELKIFRRQHGFHQLHRRCGWGGESSFPAVWTGLARLQRSAILCRIDFEWRSGRIPANRNGSSTVRFRFISKAARGTSMRCCFWRLFYILSIKANTTACCSSLNLDHRSRSFLCESVRETGESSSANSWESVIPKAMQIFSNDAIVGTIFLRYHEEIVDWGKPERSASWYSVQPRSSRYVVMAERISFTCITPLLVFFVNYTFVYRCSLIILIV